MTEIAAIIVANGTGTRFGGEKPKQFAQLGSKRVVDWSVEAFTRDERISKIVLVGPAELDDGKLPQTVLHIAGGDNRTESVRAGLSALTLNDDAIVLIHDGARPGLNRRIISDLIDALDSADAAAPALSVSDALKRETEGNFETVDRARLVRVQTPQAFRFAKIKAALSDTNTAFVDDLEAVEANGTRMVMTKGDEALLKVTYPEDIATLETLLNLPQTPPRMGSGFDVHAFEPGDHVTLCGCHIPHTHKLKGHSDADVAWHALTDAILGALALGDIGDHFPPSDPQWKGADSKVFLAAAMNMAKARGYTLANCDLTIMCEAPKVKPHRDAMRQRTAEILDVDSGIVSVKATTTEKLGFTGRSEGIAAQAVAMLVPCPTLQSETPE